MSTRTIMKQVLVQGDRALKPVTGITVLIYHRVGGGSDSEIDLDLDAFRAQLEHLREHHSVVSLDDAAAILGSDPEAPTGGPTDQSSVVITFDDGTDDFCDHVVPALVEYDLPA
ncbi:MAG: polysaccharide deacetylase family protein, partial [Ilumatobacteraceae bacterium]